MLRHHCKIRRLAFISALLPTVLSLIQVDSLMTIRVFMRNRRRAWKDGVFVFLSCTTSTAIWTAYSQLFFPF